MRHARGIKGIGSDVIYRVPRGGERIELARRSLETSNMLSGTQSPEGDGLV